MNKKRSVDDPWALVLRVYNEVESSKCYFTMLWEDRVPAFVSSVVVVIDVNFRNSYFDSRRFLKTSS